MVSVNTNYGALVALQQLSRTNEQIQITQARLSTGLEIGSARDDGATYALALGMRSDLAGHGVVGQSLERTISIVDIAIAAGEAVSDTLLDLRDIALAASDSSITADQRSVLNEEFTALRDQISNLVASADFGGVNLIDGSSLGGISALANVQGTRQIRVEGFDLRLSGHSVSVPGSATASSNGVSGKFGSGVSSKTDQVTSTSKAVITESLGASSNGVSGKFGSGVSSKTDQVTSTSKAVITESLGASSNGVSGKVGTDVSSKTDQSTSTGKVATVEKQDSSVRASVQDSAAALANAVVGKVATGIPPKQSPSISSALLFGTLSAPVPFIVPGLLGVQSSAASGQAASAVANEVAGKVASVVEAASAVVNEVADKAASAVVNEVADKAASAVVNEVAGKAASAVTSDVSGKDSVAVTNEVSARAATDVSSKHDQFAYAGGSASVGSSVSSANGVVGSGQSGGGGILTLSASASLSSVSEARSVVQDLDRSIKNIAGALGKLGGSAKVLDSQHSFIVRKADTISVSIGRLIDADIGRETARLRSLQVKQSLGLQVLSIANSAPSLAISLLDPAGEHSGRPVQGF